MKIAYLILAHNHPQHLQRLVNALASPTAVCFVHIDKKADMGQFSSIQGKNVVLLEERLAVYWGDFTMVEATLLLIRQALADPRHFTRFVLLSGTDYPLRSGAWIEAFFHEQPTTEFINLVQMPAVAERKPLDRITHFWSRPQSPTWLALLHRAQKKLGIKTSWRYRRYKQLLGHLTPYAGDQWWALTRAACETIENFIKEEPAIMRFFANTGYPDEMFFQIILGNSPLKAKIQRNVTYVDWRIVGEHPAWLEEQHLQDLFDAGLSFRADDWYGAGPILFARKFSDQAEKLVGAVEQRFEDQAQRHRADKRSNQGARASMTASAAGVAME